MNIRSLDQQPTLCARAKRGCFRGERFIHGLILFTRVEVLRHKGIHKPLASDFAKISNRAHR